MKNLILIGSFSTITYFTITGWSAEKVLQLGIHVFLVLGVPYLFYKYTNKICADKPHSLITKIFKTSDGGDRFFPFTILLLTWILTAEWLTNGY